MYILLFLVMIYFISHLWKRQLGKYLYCAILLISAIWLIKDLNNETIVIYNSALFNLITELITLIYLYFILRLIYSLIIKVIYGYTTSLSNICFVCSGIATAYSSAMAIGVDTIRVIASFICIPALFYIGADHRYGQPTSNESHDMPEASPLASNIITALINCFIFITFCVCLSQKLICSYAWWGDTEASYWEKTESSHLSSLAGFKFSNTEICKYDGLVDIINNYVDASDTIVCFPYTIVYNILCNNYNQTSFASVLFYDVCPDDVARDAASYFKDNEPTIFIYQDIPGCMETHEALFRENGNLCGQRDILNWFISVSDTDYNLVVQADNVYVYVLNKAQ